VDSVADRSATEVNTATFLVVWAVCVSLNEWFLSNLEKWIK
jgi:hypothetical protein